MPKFTGGSSIRQVVLATLMLVHCKTQTPAGSVASATSPATPENATSSKFVEVSGTTFTLDGKPFAFQGTNFYRLSLRDLKFTPSEVDDIMTKLSSGGLKVLRVWGFGCETPSTWTAEMLQGNSSASLGPAILDQHGQINESALSYLDLVVAQAAKHNLKLIIPFVNFEPQYCGMAWWVKVHGDPGESRQAFYCNQKVINAYKSYVETILNRKNTVSGIMYKDDPAIMDIEVANEPHTTDLYESGGAGPIDAACKPFVDGKPGTLVNHWLGEITTFVRSIDHNHLISTGEEGYRVRGGDGRKNTWVFDGSKGVDFDRNIALPNVSFATTHLYPDNWNVASSEFQSWFVPQVIQDRAKIAHAAGKPIIIEETGYATVEPTDHSAFAVRVAAAGYAADRAKWLDQIYQAANQAGYAGTMIWQSVPNRADGTPYDNDSYTFSFKDPPMESIYRQVKVMNGP